MNHLNFMQKYFIIKHKNFMKKITLTLALCFGIIIKLAAAQSVNYAGAITIDSKAEEFIFSGKGVTNIPAEVFSMKNLKELDLSCNCISEIPSSIKNLSSLTKLNLSGNKIYELPAEISRLKFLKEIYLDRDIWRYRLEEVKKLTHARIILVG